MSIDKYKLAKEIASKKNISIKEAKDILSLTISLIKEHVENGEEIKFKNFGKFYLKEYKEREIVQKFEGKKRKIKVPAYKKIAFKSFVKLEKK